MYYLFTLQITVHNKYKYHIYSITFSSAKIKLKIVLVVEKFCGNRAQLASGFSRSPSKINLNRCESILCCVTSGEAVPGRCRRQSAASVGRRRTALRGGVTAVGAHAGIDWRRSKWNAAVVSI